MGQLGWDGQKNKQTNKKYEYLTHETYVATRNSYMSTCTTHRSWKGTVQLELSVVSEECTPVHQILFVHPMYTCHGGEGGVLSVPTSEIVVTTVSHKTNPTRSVKLSVVQPKAGPPPRY